MQTVGAEAIVDAVVTNTTTFVRTSQPSNGRLAGSLVLSNIRLNDVPVAVGVANGQTVLNGGTTTIPLWVQGNQYVGTNPNPTFRQGSLGAANKAASILDSAGRVFGKTHPQYADFSTSQFVSARSQGAAGDGRTDDTAAIQRMIDQVRTVTNQRLT
jgi:hypothetical protein